VIASQAMISGIFSIVYQGITTRIMPLLKVEFTSPHLRSQIYIDVVNWMLLFAVLFVIAIFRSSNNLTHAYGLAVSGTMAITAILVVWILILRGQIVKTLLASSNPRGHVRLSLGQFQQDPDGWLLVACHRIRSALHHPDLRERPEEAL